MHHHTHQAPPSDQEIHLLIAEGAVLPLQGTLDPMVWGQQAMMGLGCSMLLGGRPVLLQDWLPGLDAQCHGDALTSCAHMTLDWHGEWPELHARIRWWLALPSNTAPTVHSLRTRLGVLRMQPRSEAELQPDHAMRLVCDWGTVILNPAVQRP
ncbi:MAG: hypothetical protein ACK4K3_14410 [Aquabacterium sp.]